MSHPHSTVTHATTRPGRILGPDLARGLMLLTIALANVSVYLWGRDLDPLSGYPVEGTALDRWLSAIMIIFIDGHVYPMFAFLFGYGITQFAYSRVHRGITPQVITRMLVRRHLWLLGFGAVHATLLFAGDILGAYALTGLVLTPVLMRASNRALRITLWVSGAVIGAGAILVAAFLVVLGLALPAEGSLEELMDLGGGFDSTLLIGGKAYGWSMLVRFGVWLLSSIGSVTTLTVPLMVLLGGFAARYRWLELTVTSWASLPRIAAGGITVGVLGALPAGLVHTQVIVPSVFLEMAFLLLAGIAGFAGGLGYVALFGVVAQTTAAKRSRAVRAIAAVGERSLSSYLLQSLLFAPLLAAWGFGVGERIGVAAALGIAVLVWLCSLALALGCARHDARGPAEALLRRLTYGRDDTISRPLP